MGTPSDKSWPTDLHYAGLFLYMGVIHIGSERYDK